MKRRQTEAKSKQKEKKTRIHSIILINYLNGPGILISRSLGPLAA